MITTWKSLDEIASHVGSDEPFPIALPKVEVCDFDDLKNQCCIHRAGKLSSVDTVLSGRDGRLYFVEFKDSEKNPIASLKKKAFDSLSVYWMTLGRSESMSSICSRAVFVYVKPDSEIKKVASDELFDFFAQDSGGLPIPKSQRGKPIQDWLNDFKVARLYCDIEVMGANEFSNNFFSRFYSGKDVSFEPKSYECGCDREELHPENCLKTDSLNRILSNVRQRMNVEGRDFCEENIEGIDFEAAIDDLLRCRMYLQKDDFNGNRQDLLHVASAWRDGTLYFYHNWDCIKYPFASLVNCLFDSSYLAGWFFSPSKTFDEFSSCLEAFVAYDGKFDELKRSPNLVWLQEFYDNYIAWFNGTSVCERCPNTKFGLGCFVEDRLYNKIEVTDKLPLMVR